MIKYYLLLIATIFSICGCTLPQSIKFAPLTTVEINDNSADKTIDATIPVTP